MCFLQIRRLLLIVVVCVALVSIAFGGSSVTFASRVNQVVTSTVTVGTGFTTSASQSQSLVNRAFTLVSTTGTTLQCEFWNLTFTADQGQYLSVNFTSNIPLDVYVVQDTAYQNWLKQGSCGDQADAVASKMLAASYNFTVVLPSSSGWDIVLVNSSNTRDASGFIVAYLATGNVVTEELLSTVTTTITPVGVTNTSNVASAPITGIPSFPAESIVIGIVIGLAVLIILRRGKHKK